MNGDTLTGPDTGGAWQISGSDTGFINSSSAIQFSDVENLTGAAGDDSFTVGSSGSLTGIVSGGTGTDTLIHTDGTNTWDITAANAGDVSDIGSFTGIENLTGGSGNDTFNIATTATLSGNIDGRGGSDTLTQADDVNAWNISGVNSGSVTDLTGTF